LVGSLDRWLVWFGLVWFDFVWFGLVGWLVMYFGKKKIPGDWL